MFISEEEAKRRLEDSRNIFSPSYDPDKEDETKEVVTPEVGERDSEKGSHMPTSDIDRLLSGVHDPASIRARTSTLRGQTDAQVAIGTTAEILGPSAAGHLYDLSHPQTVAYRQGLSSSAEITTGQRSNPGRVERMKTVREQLAEKASGRLSQALKSLTDTKIDALKGPQISAIAKDMAVVMDKVTRDNSQSEGIHFHIFRPEIKTIEQYTTVRVSAPIVVPKDGESSS